MLLTSISSLLKIDLWGAIKSFYWVTNNNTINSYYNLFNYTNIIKNIELLFDKGTRVTANDASYYNELQVFQNYKLANPCNFIGVYSFSENTFNNEIQPSGFVNLTNIIFNMKIDLCKNLLTTFKFFAVRYNVLKFANNSAGLVFVNNV